MNSFLMYKDKDFDVEQELCSNADILIDDLELKTIFEAAAQEDEFIQNVMRVALLGSLRSIDDIKYRQDILKDVINNFEVIKQIYLLNVEAIEQEKSIFFAFFRKYPDVILSSSIKRVDASIRYIKKIKDILKASSSRFKSEGLKNLIKILDSDLNDSYIGQIEVYLKELRLRDGVFMYFKLGKGMKGQNYTLYKKNRKHYNWFQKIFQNIIVGIDTNFRFCIDSRDESGARILSQMRNQGKNSVANTLALTADHLKCFLNTLRSELAFYIGSFNIYKFLNELSVDVVFPIMYDASMRVENYKSLRDISLILTKKESVVENNLQTKDKELFVITGANKGGKTSYLRSIAIAGLMMQCGMFVTAEKFESNISDQFFTHFKKDEDNSLKSGKFDEELKRMSDIVEQITPNSLMVFNESFSATNESEGSFIATQIVKAFIEKKIKIFFITHMYSFAETFLEKNLENTVFLRAERDKSGKRSYKIKEGIPLKTSFGEDIYKKIFT